MGILPDIDIDMDMVRKVFSSSIDPYLFNGRDCVGIGDYFAHIGARYISDICKEAELPYIELPKYEWSQKRFIYSKRIDDAFARHNTLYRCEYPILDILRLWLSFGDSGYAGMTLKEFADKIYNRST